MDAMYEHETIRVDDLPSERRWPELARRIPELGVASMLCFQLFVAGDDLGTLNLLARRPGAFTDESERLGLLFASHAAVAVAQAQKVTHLNTALASRDVIGQARTSSWSVTRSPPRRRSPCSSGSAWTPTAECTRLPSTSPTLESWPPTLTAECHPLRRRWVGKSVGTGALARRPPVHLRSLAYSSHG